MVMSESEVKANVLQAKDQKAQIKICAELNNTFQGEEALKRQEYEYNAVKALEKE